MVNKLVPEISVIMPVYNAFPYIKESINSLLTQDYLDFEAILVDDGSDDGITSSILKFILPIPKIALKPCFARL